MRQLKRIRIVIAGLIAISVIAGTIGTIDAVYKRSYQEAFNQAYDTQDQEGYENGIEIGCEEALATRTDLRNPTYRELIGFLARDRTDLQPYIKGRHDCSDFATEVINNAELKGIRAAYVTISFPKTDRKHNVVAFETADEGLVFIEPQSDKEVMVITGEPYWRSTGSTRQIDYMDIVADIQITWEKPEK